MRRLLPGFVVLGLLLAHSWSQAQDKVYVKSKEKPITGEVKQESAKGIVIGKEEIPAEEIIDIEYEVHPLAVRTGLYRPARGEENKLNDPKIPGKRKEILAEAIKKYQEALAKLAKGEKFAARNIEYRLALLQVMQASDEGGSVDDAAAGLISFKDKHPDAWQISRALQLLGRLQLDAGKFSDAEATFRELAKANVAQEIKLAAQLWEAQVTLRSGKPEVAQKKLDVFIGKLAKDSPHALRAKVIQGECLLAANKAVEGTKLLRLVIKDTTDPGVKAAAYNALGEKLFKAEKYKEARWEFLWVEVVYNLDKAEHARALYWLWKIFANLGETERAKECLDLLLNEGQFKGMEFQRRAQREAQKKQ